MDISYLQARIEFETSIMDLLDDGFDVDYYNPQKGINVRGRTPESQLVRTIINKKLQERDQSLVKVQFTVPNTENGTWVAEQINVDIEQTPFINKAYKLERTRENEDEATYAGIYGVLDHWVDESQTEIN